MSMSAGGGGGGGGGDFSAVIPIRLVDCTSHALLGDNSNYLASFPVSSPAFVTYSSVWYDY